MNKKTLILLISILSPFVLKAQVINITLSDFANREYAFVLNKGVEKDTIQTGTLNFAGNTTINIPKDDKGYEGMGAMEVKGEKSIMLIINNENFRVNQEKAGAPYKFLNSKENTYLYALMQGEKPDVDSTLYASKFVELIRYMSELNNALYGKANLYERSTAKVYAYNKLDMEALYTSSIWHNVVDGLFRINRDETALSNDLIRVVDRIKSPEVLAHFTENAITITQQYGWETAFENIISHIKDSGKIEFPQGLVYDAFLSVQVRRGMQAPAIDGLKKSKNTYDKTLLVFYQPDCVNCKEQMELLIGRYSELKEKKVRIVTISSDDNKKVFEEDAKSFPWEDKLCDFNGYAGPNFMNFGIMGTPTYFLLDKDNAVIGRYALIKNIPF